MRNILWQKSLVRVWGAGYLVVGLVSLFFPSLLLSMGVGVSSSMPLPNPAEVWWYAPLVCSMLLIICGIGMLGLRPWARPVAFWTVISVLLTSPLWAQQVVIGDIATTGPPDIHAFFITIGITVLLTGLSAWGLSHRGVRQVFQYNTAVSASPCATSSDGA